MKQQKGIIKTKCVLKKFHIPIYDVTFFLSISDNLTEAHAKLEKYFGEPPNEYEYIGLCVRNAGKFALFLQRDYLTMNVLAHEVFHLTNRILEYINPDPDVGESYPHEHGSMLHAYLFDLIWKEIHVKHSATKG